MTVRKSPRRQRRMANSEAANLNDLTFDQVMELTAGPYIETAFSSEEVRTRQYLRHRTVLLTEYGCHGRRPWAWWMVERGESRPPLRRAEEGHPWPWDAEAVRLKEMGELRDEEREYLDKTARGPWRN